MKLDNHLKESILIMMKKLIFIILASLSFNSWSQGQNIQMVQVEPKVDAVKKVSDHAVLERINQIAKATGWYQDLKIEVKDGIVFLNGHFDSDSQRVWILDIIKKTEGVIGTIDKTENEKGETVLSPVQDEVQNLIKKAQRQTPYLLSSIVLLILFSGLSYLVYRLVKRVAAARTSNALVTSAVSRLSALIVFLIGIYFALNTSGLSTLAVTFLGGTGFIGIGIGLALKGSFENYSASLMISMRELFLQGEWVKIGSTEGIIQSVTTRGTTLTDFEGTTITIPNAQVFDSIIFNYTRNPNMRTDFTIGINSSESISKVQKIIMDILESHDEIFKKPEPLVVASEISNGTVKIRVFFWFDCLKNSRAKIKSVIIQSCLDELLKNDIQLESTSMAITLVREKELKQREKEKERDRAVEKTVEPKGETTETDLQDIQKQAAAAIPAETGENLLKK